MLVPFSFGQLLWSANGIAVGVCNAEQVPGKAITGAKSTASYVFDLVGIELAWEPCPKLGREAVTKPRFVLRFMDHSPPIASGKWTPDAFGRAYLMSDGAANYAEIYYQPVRQLAIAHQLPEVNDILGYVVVHELAHLLLGPRHTLHGVMSVRWSIEDLQMMPQHRLRFTQVEGSAIRHELGLGTGRQEGRPQCYGAEPADQPHSSWVFWSQRGSRLHQPHRIDSLKTPITAKRLSCGRKSLCRTEWAVNFWARLQLS